jgi:hypothetical protein
VSWKDLVILRGEQCHGFNSELHAWYTGALPLEPLYSGFSQLNWQIGEVTEEFYAGKEYYVIYTLIATGQL